ncbi:hypothetical protein Tco_1464770 [Tanacetum coccineum]
MEHPSSAKLNQPTAEGSLLRCMLPYQSYRIIYERWCIRCLLDSYAFYFGHLGVQFFCGVSLGGFVTLDALGAEGLVCLAVLDLVALAALGDSVSTVVRCTYDFISEKSIRYWHAKDFPSILSNKPKGVQNASSEK